MSIRLSGCLSTRDERISPFIYTVATVNHAFQRTQSAQLAPIDRLVGQGEPCTPGSTVRLSKAEPLYRPRPGAAGAILTGQMTTCSNNKDFSRWYTEKL